MRTQILWRLGFADYCVAGHNNNLLAAWLYRYRAYNVNRRTYESFYFSKISSFYGNVFFWNPLIFPYFLEGLWGKIRFRPKCPGILTPIHIVKTHETGLITHFNTSNSYYAAVGLSSLSWCAAVFEKLSGPLPWNPLLNTTPALITIWSSYPLQFTAMQYVQCICDVHGIYTSAKSNRRMYKVFSADLANQLF